MYKRYPSVQSMSAFIHAARSGSFSSAARQLDLTHSAISQQIRALEAFIGQPLFLREAGGSSLTDAGQLFAHLLADGLAQVDRALWSVKNRNAPQRLVLDVDNELAQSWLNARLPALLEALPGHELVMLSVPRSERASFERVDLALRYGYGDWEDCESEVLCDDQVTVLVAPALLARYGLQTPLTPEQVLALPLLGYTRRSWIPWLDAAGLAPIEPNAVMTFDNVANLIAAIKAGVGAGLARGLLSVDGLNQGSLVKATEVSIQAHYNLYAIWPPGRGEQVAPVVEAVRRLALQTLEPMP
ncbi:MAG: LysR substrate-binding domain-containing protein [Pseudomonas sp.]